MAAHRNLAADFGHQAEVWLSGLLQELERPERVIDPDEVYYEWRYHAWTRNRFIIGGGKSLSERLALDIYYVRQNDGFSHPGDLNAVGFTLRRRF